MPLCAVLGCAFCKPTRYLLGFCCLPLLVYLRLGTLGGGSIN